MGHDHLIPNTTQVPNAVLDLLMPFLNDGEARVLLYLCRRIYGFNRDSDTVSLSQFVEGIRTAERQLDFGAGVSRQGAMNAIAVLKEFGIVEQLSGGRGRGNIPVFRINLKCEMVEWLDLISQDAKSAREKIVQRLDLLRQKGLPYGPLNGKRKNPKASKEKVEILDLSEKVETAPEKGLTVRPTKPSITKPRKKIPPDNANALSTPKGANGTRLANDWQPTDDDLAWAKAKGFDTLLDLALETEEFCNYWHAATKNAKKLDWSRTWHNRIIDQAKIAQRHRSRASPLTPKPLTPEQLAKYREIDEKGGGW